MRIIIDNRYVDKEYALKYRYMGGVKGFKFLRNEIEELRKQISDVCPECGKLSYLKWKRIDSADRVISILDSRSPVVDIKTL